MHRFKSFDVSAYYIFSNGCEAMIQKSVRIQIILEKNRGRKIDKTVVVQTKHSFRIAPRLPRDSQRTAPIRSKHDHGIQMAHKRPEGGKFFQKEGVLHVDEQEDIQSPENKVPAGSVPESGKSPDNQQVDGTSAGTFSITTGGIYDIITEEGSEEICHLFQNSLMEPEMYG